MINKSGGSKIKNYGGQALIEGVLMRGRNYLTAAIRAPNGKIIVKTEKLSGLYKGKISKIPFLRGLIVLWDALVLGMKYLTVSANIQNEELEERVEGPFLMISLILSLLFVIAVFFILPTLVVDFLLRFWQFNTIVINLIEGLIRLFFLIGYIWGIGQMKDVARVFAYHGAEHKTINAYEDGVEIIIENVMGYPVAHPRCGTAFLLTLVFLSTIIFIFLGSTPLIWRITSRIFLIPILSMIAYEIIRLLSAHIGHPLVSALISPNLLMQRLTTREPSKDIVEVAIMAFTKLLALEQPLS
ncbi:MAG TPA: DUF1385 domain-containing protein [Anaerolineae bacterium]|nr:DUF1385 domain-containing protein [Anaerolineae bacterium]